MIEEKCELLSYIDSSLERFYEKNGVLKSGENSSVELYTHKENGAKLIKRTIPNRNDGVYRQLKANPCANTPRIYEVCVQDDRLVVLEEYIEGETLQSTVERKTVTESAGVKVALTILTVLDTLHKMGIIHRDIKPSNVIITPKGEVYLIDFSIARQISANADNDTEAFGTVGYAPPEQYGIRQSQSTNDLFSLGVMLNVMLTGVHPTIRLPKGKLGKVIEKATNMQISKRYQTADEFKKALKKAI